MDLYQYFLKDKNVKQIIEDKKNNMLSTGYLFYCPDTETNMQFLKTIALVLLCDENGCLNCPNCLKLKEGVHPDMIMFPKGKALNVQDAKDIVLEATTKPMICSKKVIVINNIDNSSEEAQNKLLKTIEEPPKNVYFLVSATSLDNVLPTIKSRLVKIEIKPFTKNEIVDMFDSYKDHDNFDLAIQKGLGYVGKTLDVLENNKFLEVYNLSKSVVCDLKSSAEVIKFLPTKPDKNFLALFLENLSSMFRDLLMINCEKSDLVENVSIKNKLGLVKDEYSVKALLEILKIIDIANEKQNANVSVSLIIETLLVKILEVKYLCR